MIKRVLVLFGISLSFFFCIVGTTLFPSNNVSAATVDYKYDMGPGTVDTGFTQVIKTTAYSSSTGYGWASISGMDQRDRGSGTNSTYQDFCFNNADYTFKRDLANGTWYVNVITGDLTASQTAFTINAEGVQAGALTETLPAGTFKSIAFQVNVTDGQLTIDIKHNNGTSYPVRVNGIEITNGNPPSFVYGPPSITPVNYKYDLGPGTVETGFTQVIKTTAYSSGSGYGWASTSGMVDGDRGAPSNNIYRDLCYNNADFTFKRDLTNGKWFVNIITGDNSAGQSAFGIYAEGVWAGAVFSQVSAGSFKSIIFSVNVTDGQLNIDFKHNGGTNYPICINAIEITNVDPPSFYTGTYTENPPTLNVWKNVPINLSYGGYWTILSDIDQDGVCEILCCRNNSSGDHFGVYTVVAEELDGTVKWTYGTAGGGNASNSSDLGIQVYDWDNDGAKEVLILTMGSTESYLRVLNGTTGIVERSCLLPDRLATDQLVICNLTGKSYKSDILVKDRYNNLWAYDVNWNQLWTRNINDVCHYLLAKDIDNCGKDELLVGSYCLNANGTTRWTLNPVMGDHLDCLSVLTDGNGSPGAYRFVECFGPYGTIQIDGNGNYIWKKVGGHIQGVYPADILPQYPGKEVVLRDATDGANQALIIRSDTGETVQTLSNESNLAFPIEWNNDDNYEVCCYSGGQWVIKSGSGSVMAILNTNGYTLKQLNRPSGRYDSDKYMDIDGDGRPDICFVAIDSSGNYMLYIWKNTNGKVLSGAVMGSGLNYSGY